MYSVKCTMYNIYHIVYSFRYLVSSVYCIKGPKDLRTNGQKDKRTKGQNDKRTKGQKDKRTKGCVY